MVAPTPTKQNVPSGACLQRSWQAWQQLSVTAGKWIKEGIRLPWRCIPWTCRRPQKVLDAEEAAFLDKEVERMLQEQAIYKTDRTDLVTSSIYTVAKKGSGGKRRPVINLRWVNAHLPRIKFKMSTMKDVKTAITKDCWMTKVDLKDCFWGAPLSAHDQRFLSFRWRDQNYSF